MAGKEKDQKPTPTPADATYMDWSRLQFFARGTVEAGQRYLRCSAEMQLTMRDMVNAHDRDASSRLRGLLEDASFEDMLSQYLFVNVAGSLARHLYHRCRHVFPEIAALYQEVVQLREVVIDLRGLYEHADEYFAGGGKYPKKWVHEDTEGKWSVDASSTVISAEGHLIGGRLNVERTIEEAAKILSQAQLIAAPRDADHISGR